MNVKILVPANLKFSAGVREISKEAGINAGFSNKQVNMFRLVIDELFMNAIRYGSDETSNVFVEIFIEENKLICAVEDEGKGEKKITAEDLKTIIQRETENTSLEKIHGRGLAQITSVLVKEFEVLDKENGGLRIEFIMEKCEDQELTKYKTQLKSPKVEKILPEKTFKIQGNNANNNIEELSNSIKNFIQEHKDKAFRLILDLSELEYCDSMFLGKIAMWHSQLEANDGECVISKPSSQVFETIDLIGLTNVLTVKKDE